MGISQGGSDVPNDRASLLASESVGGIAAGTGFDFQTRYAVCHLPLWMQDGSFHQLFFEGTGDIDVRFLTAGASTRIHIQVKDHEVGPAEFRAVLEQFQKLDIGLPGVYQRFTLACPALSATLRPLENALNRYRGAKSFYDDFPTALGQTKQGLDDHMRKVGVQEFSEFILAKVFIDVGHGDLRHDDRAMELFVARLLNLPTFAASLRAMVQPAFAELMRTIAAHRGVVLDRATTDKILIAAVRSGNAAEEKTVVVWIHNWTSETFEPEADYELDWSSHFDRSTRGVPRPEVWDGNLVPALRAMHKEILAKRRERLVRFRGKCALSTGIALGAVFPTVGGWTFEIPQPPARVHWRSDVTASSPYKLVVDVVDGAIEGTDLVIGLNVRGDSRAEVIEYIASTGRPPRLFAFFSSPSVGALGIAGAEEAVAFAVAAREQIGTLLKQHRVSSSRLFFYGPFALAVFLGQQLTSVGKVELFEYQNPGYVPSCTLTT